MSFSHIAQLSFFICSLARAESSINKKASERCSQFRHDDCSDFARPQFSALFFWARPRIGVTVGVSLWHFLYRARRSACCLACHSFVRMRCNTQITHTAQAFTIGEHNHNNHAFRCIAVETKHFRASKLPSILTIVLTRAETFMAQCRAGSGYNALLFTADI